MLAFSYCFILASFGKGEQGCYDIIIVWCLASA